MTPRPECVRLVRLSNRLGPNVRAVRTFVTVFDCLIHQIQSRQRTLECLASLNP